MKEPCTDVPEDLELLEDASELRVLANFESFDPAAGLSVSTLGMLFMEAPPEACACEVESWDEEPTTAMPTEEYSLSVIVELLEGGGLYSDNLASPERVGEGRLVFGSRSAVHPWLGSGSKHWW